MPKPDVDIPFTFIDESINRIKSPSWRRKIKGFAEKFFYNLENRNIPDDTPPEIFKKRSYLEDRYPVDATMPAINIALYQQHYKMFAYIYKGLGEAIADALEATFGNDGFYLEIMAGAGWLAKAIAEANLEGTYIATDLDPIADAVFPVEALDAIEAIKKYPNADCYILSWPYYEDEAAAEAVGLIPEGSLILYMGMWTGGNTGTDSLFRQLQPIENLPPVWEAARKAYFTWYGFHDQLYLCRKI